MSMKKALIGAVMLLGLAVGQANAATYNFSWTQTGSDTPVSSTDPTVTAIGTIDLNAAPGTTFGLSALQAINVLVTGTLIDDFLINSVAMTEALSGAVSADGLTVSIFDFYADNNATDGFGCAQLNCVERSSASNGDDGAINILYGLLKLTSTVGNDGALYTSQVAAQSSFKVTAVSAVPVPAALPLLASGLGALGFIGWRRKRRVQASA